MKKKSLSLILVLVFCLSFAACGNSDGNYEDNNKNNSDSGENCNENNENENNNVNNNGSGLVMKILVGTVEFVAELCDNATAQALINLLPMTVNMSELGGYEKYYYLPASLPTAATYPGTIQAGDIMLWNSSCLVLFYNTHSTSYSYTKIGRIEDVTGLTAALGNGNVTITFKQ